MYNYIFCMYIRKLWNEMKREWWKIFKDRYLLKKTCILHIDWCDSSQTRTGPNMNDNNICIFTQCTIAPFIKAVGKRRREGSKSMYYESNFKTLTPLSHLLFWDATLYLVTAYLICSMITFNQHSLDTQYTTLG